MTTRKLILWLVNINCYQTGNVFKASSILLSSSNNNHINTREEPKRKRGQLILVRPSSNFYCPQLLVSSSGSVNGRLTHYSGWYPLNSIKLSISASHSSSSVSSKHYIPPPCDAAIIVRKIPKLFYLFVWILIIAIDWKYPVFCRSLACYRVYDSQ